MTKMTFKTLTFTALTALSLSTFSGPAQADGIEDWLRDTFSTDDFVGDWLRDVFGPVNADGDKWDTPSIHAKGYREAVEIMAGWPKPKVERGKVTQLCDGDKLLMVVLKGKDHGGLDRLMETCFK